MQSITVQSHVGEDGILRLQIPVGIKDTDVEVTLALQDAKTKGADKLQEDLGWPPGYLEKVIGSWQGEFPVLEDEGEYEVREELP